jgi:hypothetical protein
LLVALKAPLAQPEQLRSAVPLPAVLTNWPASQLVQAVQDSAFAEVE